VTLRLLACVSVLTLAACGTSPPPVVYKPLDYSYLPPIMLKVATVSVQNTYMPDAGAATLLGQDPETPGDALMQVASRRLVADGTPGTASFTIETASIEEIGGNFTGTLAARLDVVSADGRRTGFTEASVTYTEAAPDPGDVNATDAALFDVTKQLMDLMNVKLQYQIQRSLADWVAYAPNAAAPPLNSGALANGAIQAAPLPSTAVIPGPPGAAPANTLPTGSLPLGVLPLGSLPPAPPPPAASGGLSQ
jgi:hypothetical protein